MINLEEIYADHPELLELLTTKPTSKEELIGHYLPSKLWRMNNLYMIIDKAGDRIPFVMNFAQHRVYAASIEHPRLIILKSRQQGISTFWLLSFLDDTIFYSNFNCGLMAQGKDEAATLLIRLKFAWHNLDDWVKALLGVRVVKDNSQEFTLSNNSTMFIRTSFRSATLQRLHISELGKIANKYPERAKETKTGTLQALAPGNTGVIESTAEGHNMFKHMWDQAVRQHAADRLAAKDFRPIFLSWLDDPDCVEFEHQHPDDEALAYFLSLENELDIKLTQEQRNFWVAQERELEGDIHQEYPATAEEAFRAAMDGTYWAKRYIECVVRRNHRAPDSYDQNLSVYIAIDVGRSDYFVMCFFQVWRNQIRIIHEYYNNGEWLGHYVNYAKEVIAEKGYFIEKWFLPHDMNVTDITEREAKTRQDILYDLGVTNTVLLEKIAVRESIEHVREAMPYIWIDVECIYLEQCFLNYTKDWNPLLEIWRDQPKRNEFAHGADAIRYTVQSCYTWLFEDEGSTALEVVNESYGGISL